MTSNDKDFVIGSPDKPDDAPKKRRGRPPGSKNKSSGKSTDTALKEGLESYVGLIGSGLTMFPRTREDGLVLLAGGDAWVEATMTLAKSDPRVRRALDMALSGGAWGGFIVATASIAVPIAANHGLVPAFVGRMMRDISTDTDDSDSDTSGGVGPDSASPFGGRDAAERVADYGPAKVDVF